MKHICLIVGARPNFIKCAPIYHELKKEFKISVLHTGQHYSTFLSEDIIKELDMEIDLNLKCRVSDRSILTDKVREALKSLNPGMVIVFGDVNSTYAGALATKQLNKPLAHIEAGLRSGNWEMEEEINRYFVDSVSDLLFCTEKSAIENIQKEFKNKIINLSGNTHIDMLHKISDKIMVKNKPYTDVVITLHRKENIYDKDKLLYFSELIEKLKKFDISFYAHPNLKQALKKLNMSLNIPLSKPKSYLEFLKILYNSKLLITDSGGASTEAAVLGIPCLVYRDETEYEHKTCLDMKLIATMDKSIATHYCKSILALPKSYRKIIDCGDGWSDGKASERISCVIKEYMENNNE